VDLYGEEVGGEDLLFLSWTGDVDLLLQYPLSYDKCLDLFWFFGSFGTDATTKEKEQGAFPTHSSTITTTTTTTTTTT